MTAIEIMEREVARLLDALEDMARQHCLKSGSGMTDSGALSADADALCLLAEHKRFRIVRGYGRMFVGYWPEDDPERAAAEGKG